jgi:hypothetical protein
LRVADIQACYEEWKARGQSLSRHRSTAERRSAATCATRTDTSSRSASPLACCTASSPKSAPRTSLAELCHRPGTPASKPRSANLRWRDKFSGVSRINRGRSVRIKWGQASHQHGHDGEERQHAPLAARSAASVPPWSPAHPTRRRASRSRPEGPTTGPGTGRRSERPGRTCRRAPPAARWWGGPLAHCTARGTGVPPQTCPQRLTQPGCQNSRWNVSSTWGWVGVEMSRETTCPPAP